MVKNTGKAPGAGAIRPLNLPVPVVVKEDENRRPVSVVLCGRRLEIASTEDVWEIDDEWWRPVRYTGSTTALSRPNVEAGPVHRLYYRTITTEGASLTLFRDVHDERGGAGYAEGWYCSR